MHKQTQTKTLLVLPEKGLTKTFFFPNEAVNVKIACLNKFFLASFGFPRPEQQEQQLSL